MAKKAEYDPKLFPNLAAFQGFLDKATKTKSPKLAPMKQLWELLVAMPLEEAEETAATFMQHVQQAASEPPMGPILTGSPDTDVEPPDPALKGKTRSLDKTLATDETGRAITRKDLIPGPTPTPLEEVATAEETARSGVIKKALDSDRAFQKKFLSHLAGSDKDLAFRFNQVLAASPQGSLFANFQPFIEKVKGAEDAIFGGPDAKANLIETLESIKETWRSGAMSKDPKKTAALMAEYLKEIPQYAAGKPNAARVLIGAWGAAAAGDEAFRFRGTDSAGKPVNHWESIERKLNPGKAATPTPTPTPTSTPKTPTGTAAVTEEIAEAAGLSADDAAAVAGSKYNRAAEGLARGQKSLERKGLSGTMRSLAFGTPEQEIAIGKLLRNKGGLKGLGRAMTSPLGVLAAMVLPSLYGGLFNDDREVAAMEASVPTLAERLAQQRAQEIILEKQVQAFGQNDPAKQQLLLAELRKLDQAAMVQPGVPGRHTFGGVPSTDDMLMGG